MQKHMICLLIILAMQVSGTAAPAAEDPAILPDPAVVAQGAPAPARQKPMSGIHVGDPQFLSPTGLFFISPSTDLTIKVIGGGGGTAKTEYRLDSGPWMPYEPFRIAAAGPHEIQYRSSNDGMEESPRSFSVVVDGTPPKTEAFLDGNPVVPGRPGMIGKKSMMLLETKDEGSGISLVEYRLDQGAWQSYAPFPVPSKGLHAVSWRSIDNVGNREEENTITITSERIPAKTSLVAGEPKYAGNELVVSEKTQLTLAVESMTGGTATEFAVDGGEWRKYAPFNLSGGGKHQISFRSTDAGGIKEPVQTVAVVVDVSPPETSLAVDGRKVDGVKPLVVKGETLFSIIAEDALAPIKATEYRLDGGEWRPAEPFSLTVEGKHEIQFRSTDVLGNMGLPSGVTVIYDKTPPVSELVVGQPQKDVEGVIHVSPTTLFQPRGTDGISGVERVEYSIDGREDARDTVPFTIATPGKYRIDYQGLDKAGNKEPMKTVLVWVDQTLSGGSPNIQPVAGGERREFKFEGKQGGVPAAMPAVATITPAPLSAGTSEEADPMANGPLVTDGAGSASFNPYQGRRPGTQQFIQTQKESNISLWEYVTLGIVNFALIVGVMLL